MKLLILGANGQLGQELADLCAARRLPTVLATKASCDIAEPDQVSATIRSSRPDVVVNAAAYTQVDGAESNSELAFRVNRDGPGYWQSCPGPSAADPYFDRLCLRRHQARPYVDQDTVRPLGLRASKEAGEREIGRSTASIILRTARVWPLRQELSQDDMTLASTRDRWGVVDDQIGTPTATEDIAQAVLCAAYRAAAADAAWGTYHFAGTAEGSWHAFASDIIAEQAKYTSRTPEIRAIATEDYPTVARRPQNSRLNSDLFASTFGYRAKRWGERVPSIVEALWADRRERAQ